MRQAKEALTIYERLGDTERQAECLIKLALLFQSDEQLDAAEEAAFRAIDLLPEKGQQFLVCESHQVLGNIYQSKGEIEKAIHHFEAAIEIASHFNWHHELFSAHCKLAVLFLDEGRFDDAQTHIEHEKSHTANNAYHLGLTMEGQAWIWYDQHRLEEAKSEALRTADLFEKLGAAEDLERCREFLQHIETELNTPVASGQSSSDCEFL